MTLQDIYHFLEAGEGLYTGGMPTAEQLAEAARAGVQVVINLAMPDSERALPDEAAVAGALGLRYVGIPVRWDGPTDQDLRLFMDAMDANRGATLLVHCQANYRATAFVALYRVRRLGWQPEQALGVVRSIWNPNEYPVWKAFIERNIQAGAQGT